MKFLYGVIVIFFHCFLRRPEFKYFHFISIMPSKIWSTIGPPAKHHLNAFRWLADVESTLGRHVFWGSGEKGYVFSGSWGALEIFRGAEEQAHRDLGIPAQK